MSRFRVLLVSAAFVMALAPVSAFAQTAPSQEEQRAAALAAWRSTTLELVPASFRDLVAASYAGTLNITNLAVLNEIMAVKARAEGAALLTLSTTQVALIQNAPVSRPPASALVEARAAAVAAWRAATLALVPASFRDLVAASYAGTLNITNPDLLNQIMAVKTQAEQNALRQLTSTQRTLIFNTQ